MVSKELIYVLKLIILKPVNDRLAKTHYPKNSSFDAVFQETLVDQELKVQSKLLQQKYVGFSQQIQIENMVDEMHKFAGFAAS